MITIKVKFKQFFPTKPFFKIDTTNFTELLRICLQSPSKRTWEGLNQKSASAVKQPHLLLHVTHHLLLPELHSLWCPALTEVFQSTTKRVER